MEDTTNDENLKLPYALEADVGTVDKMVNRRARSYSECSISISSQIALHLGGNNVR